MTALSMKGPAAWLRGLSVRDAVEGGSAMELQKLKGQALVEYGLIIALIAVVTAAGVQVFGTSIVEGYQHILTSISAML